MAREGVQREWTPAEHNTHMDNPLSTMQALADELAKVGDTKEEGIIHKVMVKATSGWIFWNKEGGINWTPWKQRTQSHMKNTAYNAIQACLSKARESGQAKHQPHSTCNKCGQSDARGNWHHPICAATFTPSTSVAEHMAAMTGGESYSNLIVWHEEHALLICPILYMAQWGQRIK